ncbi:MAG: arsenate reductase (glutaredoxin) [Gemmatimonadetes bacterium]|nr:arsenate reductase (glutaredoxin) [Gemmatimonadota bacterium]
MLEENDIPYRYREYRQDPLSASEIEDVLGRLGLGPREMLRTHDRVAKELGLSGTETDDELVALMAEHPTLLQRPIGLLGERAVVGRPPENLLDLTE